MPHYVLHTGVKAFQFIFVINMDVLGVCTWVAYFFAIVNKCFLKIR